MDIINGCFCRTYFLWARYNKTGWWHCSDNLILQWYCARKQCDVCLFATLFFSLTRHLNRTGSGFVLVWVFCLLKYSFWLCLFNVHYLHRVVILKACMFYPWILIVPFKPVTILSRFPLQINFSWHRLRQLLNGLQIVRGIHQLLSSCSTHFWCSTF